MRKLSKYTLVRRVLGHLEPRQPATAADPSVLHRAARPSLRLELAVGKAPVREAHRQYVAGGSLATLKQPLQYVPQVTPLRVGVLDLSAWIGELPALLTRLNHSQRLFTLFDVQAPVPAGLLKTSKGMAQWVFEKTRETIPLDELPPHVIADEFFVAAEDIRTSLKLDLLAGVTPAMVAGLKPRQLYLRNFVSVFGKTLLVSTAGVREYAFQAGRPFEAGVGVLLVGALLVAINPEIGYHPDCGCLFDHHPSRDSLVGALASPTIEPGCFEKLTPEQREAATKLVATLKRMKITRPPE